MFFSTELIVHPILDTEYVLEEIDQWLPRLHAVVIGKSLYCYRTSNMESQAGAYLYVCSSQLFV